MKKFIHWPTFIISISIVAAISAAVCHFTKLGFWPVFGITVVALLINGFVATIEDDLPGGFNNPDGTDGTPTPTYAELSSKIGSVLLIFFCTIATVAFISLSYTFGFSSRQGLLYGCLAIATALAYLSVTRNYRWSLWAAAAIVALLILLAWVQNGG